MKVDILASGSKGNCIALTSNKNTILIDVGVAKTQIDKRLVEVGIQPVNVRAIFITHGHDDHIKGLPLANKYNIPVYAGEEEWKSINGVEDHLIRKLINCEKIYLEEYGLYIESFRTHHDAFEPLGYVVWDDQGNKTSICLDTGHVDNEMIAAMEYSTTYIIEANHQPSVLEARDDYPPVTKARILSDLGHLSNEQTANALSRLITGHGEKIFLTHLSLKTNNPTLAETSVVKALMKKGFKQNEHYEIKVV